jgi:hypothetical protein
LFDDTDVVVRHYMTSEKRKKPQKTMVNVDNKKKEVEAWDQAIDTLKRKLQALGTIVESENSEDQVNYAGNKLTITWQTVRVSQSSTKYNMQR